jgi:hypothetical protein
MRKAEKTVENLLAEFAIVCVKEYSYPKNKTYPKERLAYEKELIKRLGGDWEKYCEINGWNK